MTGSAGCGDTSPVGDEVIVGVEGAFTGVSANPDNDPTGLMMLLAMIDGRYWPLQVCGDSGIGAPFNDPDNLAGAVLSSHVNIGDPVEAHGCVLNCQYTIAVSSGAAAQCIIGKIDGKWQILRVMHTAFTGGITGPDNSCRCCGINASSSKMFARVISVDPVDCDGYQPCDEFVIRTYEGGCDYDPENPLGIRIGCFSTEGSELNNPADWEVTVCGQIVEEILSVNCCMPITACSEGSDSQSVSDSASASSSASDEECRVEITVRTGPLASCGGCDFILLIYSDPYDDDPCADTEVFIDEVDAEACGLPNLQIGDRVILAELPFRYPGVANTNSECGPVSNYIIRACQVDDCTSPCDPPPPPGECCGMTCDELPASVFASIEILDCDCACSIGRELPKVECIPGDESGQWRYNPEPDEYDCETSRVRFQIQDIQYFCGRPASDSASDSASASDSGSTSDPVIEQSAALVFNGVGGTLIESSCDPIYSVFEFASPQPICFDKLPGMIPFPDITCRVRITITE